MFEEKKINSDEFYWNKKRKSLIAKAKELAVNAPTTFEVAPWVDNSPHYGYGQQQVNYNVVKIGSYDFKQKAFPVYPFQIMIPWLAAGTHSKVATYQFVGVEHLKENHWVTMDVDAAEKLAKTGEITPHSQSA